MEKLRKFLVEVERHEDLLNKWERGFIDSIEEQLAKWEGPGSGLSPKQQSVLDRIAEKLNLPPIFSEA